MSIPVKYRGDHLFSDFSTKNGTSKSVMEFLIIPREKKGKRRGGGGHSNQQPCILPKNGVVSDTARFE